MQARFHGLTFVTDPGRVFTPRPSTEALVDVALERIGDEPARVADIGTGAGVVAVTLALRAPQIEVWASDTCGRALEVAQTNASTLGAQLQQGAKQVRIDGQTLDVACQVRSISGFSAHADEPELLGWLRNFSVAPKLTFIVHGDPEAQAAFEPKVKALGFATKVPQWRETVELT